MGYKIKKKKFYPKWHSDEWQPMWPRAWSHKGCVEMQGAPMKHVLGRPWHWTVRNNSWCRSFSITKRQVVVVVVVGWGICQNGALMCDSYYCTPVLCQRNAAAAAAAAHQTDRCPQLWALTPNCPWAWPLQERRQQRRKKKMPSKCKKSEPSRLIPPLTPANPPIPSICLPQGAQRSLGQAAVASAPRPPPHDTLPICWALPYVKKRGWQLISMKLTFFLPPYESNVK